MANERVKCGICEGMILPTTAQIHGGLCARCVKIPPSRRGLAAAVHAEPNPFERALAMYSSLIDSLGMNFSDRDFGVISDPEITTVRFYTPTSLNSLMTYDESVEVDSAEVGSEVVDEIEYYLSAGDSDSSLLVPIATKLKSLSPTFNSIGRTVFFASWGMGVKEIAWLIRYLNDRTTFERFLDGTGLTEEQVDVFNESYGRELN